MNSQKVKIIRMQTGEDIVANILEEDEDSVILNNPMRLIFRRMPTGQSVMMMLPWLPIELIKDDSAIVYLDDIITVMEPKDSMIEYYGNLVNKSLLDSLEFDDMLEKTLAEQEEEMEEINEITEELSEQFEEIKNRTLH
jgi:hypothetical protein